MSVNFAFTSFNNNILNKIIKSIDETPVPKKYIKSDDLKPVMEITQNTIKLLRSVCIIKYYDRFRIIGKMDTNFYLFTLPEQVNYILSKVDITFKNLEYLSLLESQYGQSPEPAYDYIDYYQSVTNDGTTFTLDTNGFKLYTLC